jgi:hypothetical protein
VLLFVVSALYAETINGMDVQQYAGQVTKFNHTGTVELLLQDNSTAHWNYSNQTTVWFNQKRVPIPELRWATQVVAYVTADGYIAQINILEMKRK